MKIIQLTAENVKKLTAVEISPDGNMVQITGKNGQGKTPVLDSIWWALTGTENIQSQPIRAGQDKARIVLKLGVGKEVSLIVERRFTPKASYLEVKTADGAKYPSPAKMLDDLVGALTFDPLHFMREDAKGQFEILKRLVKMDIDPAAIDAANDADYKKRTDINRDLKAKTAQAAGIQVRDNLPEKPVSEEELLDAIQAAGEHNAEIERRRANRELATTKIDDLRAEANRLESTMDAANLEIVTASNRECDLLQEQIDALKARITSTKESARARVNAHTEERAVQILNARREAEDLETRLQEAGALPDVKDLAALRAQLDQAKVVNIGIANRTSREAILLQVQDLDTQSKTLTEAMEKRTADKDAAIASATMPIEGLTFGNGVVMYKGLPLDQASDAEQLEVSTAMAAALNPKLRVIRIRDGSLLDDDAMKRLAAFADERDMQIWIERVDGSGTVGVVMEDGHVRGQDHQAQAAE